MKNTIPFCIALIAAPAIAQDTRELDAHEHGVGALDIAIDGSVVAMALHVPGADIVGFEYKAESDADLTAIDAALAILEDPMSLFVFPEGAECRVTGAEAALEGEGAHDDHNDHDHDEHDEHAHEDEHDDHDHDDHEEHDDHDEHEDHDAHDDHDEHEHEHDEAGESHSEFHAEYAFTCDNITALTGIELAYFAAFENALELEVQIVTEDGATAFEVKRDDPSLDLGDLF